MKTRPTIVIPILTQTEFLQFEEKYVSKVISDPRNEPGWSVYSDFEGEWDVGS